MTHLKKAVTGATAGAVLTSLPAAQNAFQTYFDLNFGGVPESMLRARGSHC